LGIKWDTQRHLMPKHSEVLLLNVVVNIVTSLHSALIYAASCLSFTPEGLIQAQANLFGVVAGQSGTEIRFSSSKLFFLGINTQDIIGDIRTYIQSVVKQVSLSHRPSSIKFLSIRYHS